MAEFEPESFDVENESQDHDGISRLGAATMGLAWGLITFEGGTALYNFVIDNHDGVTDYTLNNQLRGVALFGIGGAVAMGRFIYNQAGKTDQ